MWSEQQSWVAEGPQTLSDPIPLPHLSPPVSHSLFEVPGATLPQGLCTCCVLFPRYFPSSFCAWLSHPLQISNQHPPPSRSSDFTMSPPIMSP